MTFVAVYGSLMRGFGNHRLLEGSRYVGRGTADAPFCMVALGGFPGAFDVEDPDAQAMLVEVYEVDDATLERLDCLEGNGRFYQRREVHCTLIDDDGFEREGIAWVYLLMHPERYYTKPVVPDNDWRSFCKVMN